MTGDTNANIAAMAAGGSDMETGLFSIKNESSTSKLFKIRLEDSSGFFFSETIPSNSIVLAQIPLNTPLRITTDSVNDISQTYPSIGSRTIVVDHDFALGVFIQTIDGKRYTVNEWAGQNTPNGVALITNNGSFLIALENLSSSFAWGDGINGGSIITGVSTSPNYSMSGNKFTGKADTDILVSYDNAYAAKAARNYTFPNGQKGYLGAGGEWAALDRNDTSINECLTACGGQTIDSYNEYYWTTTHWFDNTAWFFAEGTFHEGARAELYKVRPFATL